MGFMHRHADGTIEFRENFDIQPFGTEDDRYRFIMAMTEAAGEGKSTKLEAKIAAMPVAVTRNKTFYPADQLEASLPSWTTPYPCPVIKDHNEYEVDGIVGRIQKAYLAKDGANECLWFDVVILDAVAQEKVANGTWAQVSIGTRVESAVCSICGTDIAKSPWCGHERGDYYLKDENDPTSVAECFWIMGQITGREVSFVTTPSAATAGVRNSKSVKGQEAEEPRHYDGMILAWASESDTDALRMIEAAYEGSPAGSFGEAIVPSSAKEESVEKPEAKEAEVIETEETKVEETELSDDTTKGEEEAPEETKTEADEADGPDAEEKETEEVAAEDEADKAESEETTEEVETDLEASESDEDAPAADEADEQKEEEQVEEQTREQELLARVAELETQVLSLKAQVYVESGLRDCILVGERDALVEMHMAMKESSLDDLMAAVASRRSRVSTTDVEEVLKHKVESPVLRISDDDNADKHNSDDIIVSVKTKEGAHSVTVAEDHTKVTITPKLHQ